LLLGSLEHTADVTPGGEWTVRQTAVHLICFPRLFRQFLNGLPSPLSSMADTEIMNTAFFLAMDAEDPQDLAALLDAGTNAYANDAATHRADDPCPFHLGMTLDVATEVAIQTSELLQHGWDIAQATHRTFQDDQSALAVLLAMPELWATLLPPNPSRQTGTLAICPSNDPCYIYMLDPERTSVSRVISDEDWTARSVVRRFRCFCGSGGEPHSPTPDSASQARSPLWSVALGVDRASMMLASDRLGTCRRPTLPNL
jgi:hypothetical protein